MENYGQFMVELALRRNDVQTYMIEDFHCKSRKYKKKASTGEVESRPEIAYICCSGGTVAERASACARPTRAAA